MAASFVALAPVCLFQTERDFLRRTKLPNNCHWQWVGPAEDNSRRGQWTTSIRFALWKHVLVLLRHKSPRRERFRVGAAQQGHRDNALMIATISRRRMVAIEFGTCRSGRSGGSSGSIIAGNGRFRDAPDGTSS